MHKIEHNGLHTPICIEPVHSDSKIAFEHERRPIVDSKTDLSRHFRGKNLLTTVAFLGTITDAGEIHISDGRFKGCQLLMQEILKTFLVRVCYNY